jgi:phage gpG-like protein
MLKNPPSVRVGIFGDGRNATVGAAHEFGTTTHPQRSFLRVPIMEEMPKALKRSGIKNSDFLKKMLRTGNLNPLMARLGVLAEGIVIGGFNTGGYGRWIPSNMKYKHNKQTLVETKQLRESITHEVVEGS